MFNPLFTDISHLKNDDLHAKITELTQKYYIAARSGQGGLCSQIYMLMEHYKGEQQKRFDQANKKLTEQNKNLNDFINVDR